MLKTHKHIPDIIFCLCTSSLNLNFNSDKMSIYELENLLIDPEYFLEQTFEPIINKIDIKTEEGKIKWPQKAEEYNYKREELLQELTSREV